MRLEEAKHGDIVEVEGHQFKVIDEGEGLRLERILWPREIVDRLGYDPVRLQYAIAASMRRRAS